MPSLDADNEHLALNPHGQPPPTPIYEPSGTHLINHNRFSDEIPPLPNYSYTPPTARRPSNPTKPALPHPNASANLLDQNQNSSHCHDFYRSQLEQEGRTNMMHGMGHGSLGNGARPAIPTSSRPTSPRSRNENGHRVVSKVPRASAAQIASMHQDRASLTAAKSTPALSNTARNRQTSLKELVNRFNQTPDEIPPLPPKNTSRSTSASSNSGRGTSTSARTASQSRAPSGGYPAGPSSTDTPINQNSHYQRTRRGRGDDTVARSPRSKNYKMEPIEAIGTKAYASQSMVDLAPENTHLARPPLFGEVLTAGQSHFSAGYGIQAPKRRRGSEGSMHSPNPMFPDQEYARYRDHSPPSPNSWYHGAAPPLDEIKAKGEIPDPPANLHRRTRSDYEGVPPPLLNSQSYKTDLSPPPSPKSTNASASTSRRTSQSRIPISTRRLSATSDSGKSAPSSRNNSTQDSHQFNASPRTRAPPPKPLQNTRTSPRYSRSNTPQKSPRYQTANSRSATSPRLAAYISAPMPKKSPPLRSSRPRQPVSSASTAASRARDVGNAAENGSPRAREGRIRKPPELGAVDFAARRQKIQQAFTKTVKEEEEREIRRASMMAQDSHPTEPAMEGEADGGRPAETANPHQGSFLESNQDDAHLAAPSEDSKRAEPDLTINTAQLSEHSVLDLSLEDSPTLGTYDSRVSSHSSRLKNTGSTPNSDIDPGSAVTAGTSGSVDTFFDDEPQDDSPDESRGNSRPHSINQHTLLSNIMAMRDSRTPSPARPRRRDMSEEVESGDDRESIQIMLGATPVLEKTSFNSQFEEKRRDASTSEAPNSRWSMSSWTSSTRSRDERDGPLERIDEHSPSNVDAPAHLSYSTAESEHNMAAWSPTSVRSANTDRTTMGSDGYGTVNRVLEHYHDPSVLSADTMHDFQQQLYTHSPELARQGGYESRKVTQLYLQKFAKERNAPSASMPEPLKAHINKRTSSLTVPGPVSEKEVRDDMDEKILPTYSHSRNQSSSSAAQNDVDDEGNLKPARASLTHPDDFMDMSPSLGGFYQRASDSPPDERPPLPEKDAPFVKYQPSVSTRELSGGNDFYSEEDPRLQLPPINAGQSIDINVQPPQQNDSPIIVSASAVHTEIRESSRQVDSNKPTKPPMNDWREAGRPPVMTKSSEDSFVTKDGQSIPVESVSKDQSPSPDQKRLTRRKHIIKELVDTEYSFGTDMRVIDDIYKGTCGVIIASADDVKTLFGNSDQVISFSSTFLDSLKQAAKPVYVLSKTKRWNKANRTSNATSHSGNTGDESSINGIELNDDDKDRKTFIGETFGHHMRTMEDIYSKYLKNHDAANQKLAQLQTNPKVQIWLKECKQYANDLTTAWDLDSLLVKPVQRILKYPLLLDQLLEVTPENHPDYTALDVAAREMKGVSMRINEAKKQADIFEQVQNTKRGRKDSDMRAGLAKAFGQTKKLRPQLTTSSMFDDKEYTAVAERFSEHFVRLQVVMRDVEMYTTDVERFMKKFLDFAIFIENFIDVGQTSYPELESKWRKFRMSMRDMSAMALVEHVESVRRHVVQPMTTLVKLHDGPQKLMQKRDKRLPDYARFKAINDRGDRPDKKTTEQGEQFLAVNETLKDELPKLFGLTSKLIHRCLSNFVQIQYKWLKLWKLKLKQAIDIPSAAADGDFGEELVRIIRGFTGDFAFYEAQVASLGVCNGSLLHETPNLVRFASPSTTSTTLVGDGMVSPRTGPSFDSTRRTLSVSSDKSPVLPQPDFGGIRGSGSFFTDAAGPGATPQRQGSNRMRASSSVSNNTPQTPYVPGSWRSFSNNTTPVNTTPGRPGTSGRTITDPSPSLRPSTDSSRVNRLSDDSAITRPSPGSGYPPVPPGRSASPSGNNRYSGFFSSALPMSDSPTSESPINGGARTGQDFNVIFLAASVYEFNIDRARKEAGYPYLTYVAGEIFDVLGEKGELWLAKNQDDAGNLVGWIWNKHFVKLAS